LPEVAGRDPRVALDLADALRHGLAARDKRQDLLIDLTELLAQGVEAGLWIVGHRVTIRAAASSGVLRRDRRIFARSREDRIDVSSSDL
jgi:hypothetical protein